MYLYGEMKILAGRVTCSFIIGSVVLVESENEIKVSLKA